MSREPTPVSADTAAIATAALALSLNLMDALQKSGKFTDAQTLEIANGAITAAGGTPGAADLLRNRLGVK